MFDRTSRYSQGEIRTLKIDETDGTSREVRYVGRRFLPPAESMTPIAEHIVTQGDRLDNITARYVGDSTQFWRLCDANEVMSPEELEEIGRPIRISMFNL
jgi:hypothetical protein